MNCKDFESMIHELVSRRAIDKARQLEALDHAGRCLWCARRLDEETKLTERLQAFASTLHGQRAPVRVEEELLQAFRERNLGGRALLLGLTGKRLRTRLSWALAFGATIATAWIVIFLWLRLHPGSGDLPLRVAGNQARPASEASQVKPEADRKSPVATDVAPGRVAARPALPPAAVGIAPVLRASGPARAALTGVARPQGAHARSSERTALKDSAAELTTDFISLGTCDDSQCMEEATLVRMELPAEALLAFGVGVESDYAPEGFVQADVALGSNGVPFAIRFVDQKVGGRW